MESEYVTMSLAATAIRRCWIWSICATVIFQDNKLSTIYAEGGGNFYPTKHINVRYHFVKAKIKENDIKLSYKPTKEMIADIYQQSYI
jgi:hypothetical protein